MISPHPSFWLVSSAAKSRIVDFAHLFAAIVAIVSDTWRYSENGEKHNKNKALR